MPNGQCCRSAIIRFRQHRSKRREMAFFSIPHTVGRNLPLLLHTPPMDAWNTRSAIIAFRQPLQIPSFFRSEEHTSELQSRSDLVCRLLLEKKKQVQTTLAITYIHTTYARRGIRR